MVDAATTMASFIKVLCEGPCGAVSDPERPSWFTATAFNKISELSLKHS